MASEDIKTKISQASSPVISVKEMRKLLGTDAKRMSDSDVEAFIELCVIGAEILIQSGLLNHRPT